MVGEKSQKEKPKYKNMFIFNLEVTQSETCRNTDNNNRKVDFTENRVDRRRNDVSQLGE
jgi:hypothetical protein